MLRGVRVRVVRVRAVLGAVLVAVGSRFAVVMLVDASGHLASLNARSRISRGFTRNYLPLTRKCQ